jgi:hypothetical protein
MAKVPGSLWVEGANLHYVDSAGVEWGTVPAGSQGAAPNNAVKGSLWIEGEDANTALLCYVSDEGTPLIRYVPTAWVTHRDTLRQGSLWVSSTAANSYQLHVSLWPNIEHVVHGDVEAISEHADVEAEAHADIAATHADVTAVHTDTHSDVAATHTDTSTHSDVAATHSDTAYSHTDVPHGDYHHDYVTQAYSDTWETGHAHTDTHTDQHTDNYSDHYSDSGTHTDSWYHDGAHDDQYNDHSDHMDVWHTDEAGPS